MELASIVSKSLNQAQAASNQLVRSSEDGALEQMQTLCDFLNAELPAREQDKKTGRVDEVTSTETKDAGGQDEVKEEEATHQEHPILPNPRHPEQGKVLPEETTDEALR